jgi:hypothetical protein
LFILTILKKDSFLNCVKAFLFSILKTWSVVLWMFGRYALWSLLLLLLADLDLVALLMSWGE